LEGGLGVFETPGGLIAQTAIKRLECFGWCAECVALFGTMRSVLTEANALVEKAEVLVHANKPSEYVDEWWQVRGTWQNACRNWSKAFTDFKNHLQPQKNAKAEIFPLACGVGGVVGGSLEDRPRAARH
jgi:hypothetical protein